MPRTLREPTRGGGFSAAARRLSRTGPGAGKHPVIQGLWCGMDYSPPATQARGQQRRASAAADYAAAECSQAAQPATLELPPPPPSAPPSPPLSATPLSSPASSAPPTPTKGETTPGPSQNKQSANLRSSSPLGIDSIASSVSVATNVTCKRCGCTEEITGEPLRKPTAYHAT